MIVKEPCQRCSKIKKLTNGMCAGCRSVLAQRALYRSPWAKMNVPTKD